MDFGMAVDWRADFENWFADLNGDSELGIEMLGSLGIRTSSRLSSVEKELTFAIWLGTICSRI